MPRRRPWWEDLPDAELLDLPLRRLGLRIAGSPIEPRLAADLDRAGLRHFRPYAWLSTSWFTPHGTTGFAIPFYLAHPRLARLERRMMGEAEGAGARACMRLLRHEAAHALDHAYRLHLRSGWRDAFGSYAQPYRASYVPRPGDRRFVVNLDHWYAQSHPAEDWAETFAVWLAPGSRWPTRYAGRPALQKLRYVDELMRDIRERPPAVRTRERVEPLAELDFSLRAYYHRKRARHQRVRGRGRRREYLR
jgi:hypothetical protein